MKKAILILTLCICFNYLSAQSVGFSYLFPKNGHFSNPIAPINFSLPIKAGKFFQISPGIGLYNIGGMSMSGFPESYNSQRALVGPFQSIELTILPALVLPFKKIKIDFIGGVFGFFAFNEKLIKSEFDDMLAEFHGFYSLDSQLNYKNSGFGWGYIYGVKFSFKVNKKAWGYVGINYLTGSQLYKIDGTFVATTSLNSIQTESFTYSDSKLLYQGLQLSVGAVLK
jgi:hypothetical protein